MGSTLFFGGGGGRGSGHGKLAKPTHQKTLEKSLGLKDQSCLMLQLSHKALTSNADPMQMSFNG